MAPILTVRNLSAGYGKKQVLYDVQLDVMPGEIVLITGGNGSGKTTLLKAIYGLIMPWNESASIQYRPAEADPAVATYPPSMNLVRGLAYVPQKEAVFEDMTVAENLRLAGDTLLGSGQFAERCEEVLASLPALRPLLDRKPDSMSGGERQMLAIGLALLHRPRLMLLDEPTAGLDDANSATIIASLKRLHHTSGVTIVAVEHRRHECAALGGRLCRMRLGRFEPEDILPQSSNHTAVHP